MDIKTILIRVITFLCAVTSHLVSIAQNEDYIYVDFISTHTIYISEVFYPSELCGRQNNNQLWICVDKKATDALKLIEPNW